ncbi:sulfatase family protein [Phaeodactylibacter xiamenensis]|uniref:sulfatase family protein n=1 Tax=Phaeodactylibacter xiamenensis TaxID=1524460 RepID=UPI0024A8CF66|nr:arylsulfatase [Phaeodactylibacter xiamenensis]
MKTQWILIPFLVILTLGCQNAQTETKEYADPPNIIIVLADDLGYGDVGAFNPQSKIRTPALDSIARAGMIFTDAHTSSSVCTPTRYSLLTGRYNWRSTLKRGVLWGDSPPLIPKDRLTLAALLDSAGYHTAFIGKWHLGWDWAKDEHGAIDFSKPIQNGPNSIGFDYSFGHIASLDIPPYVYVENHMPTAVPMERTANEDYQGFWRDGLTAPDFVHEEVTPNFFRRSMQYIRERAEQPEPFFLYLALPSPHTPILPSAEWQGKSGLNPYGDFVMMVDDYMGQLDATLQAAGISDNTLLIFTSDNGCSPRAKFEELAEKGHQPSHIYRGHKADIYEGGHRVPFIAKWPAVIPSKSHSGTTICLTDLMATAAELTGQALPENAGEDSYSLVPLFEQQPGYQRTATVHHSIEGEFAIRQGDWKLALCPGSGGWSVPSPLDAGIDTLPPFQLFNLSDDPVEQNNLINQHAALADSLKHLLTRYIEQGRSTPGPPQPNDGEYPWKQLDWMKKD